MKHILLLSPLFAFLLFAVAMSHREEVPQRTWPAQFPELELDRPTFDFDVMSYEKKLEFMNPGIYFKAVPAVVTAYCPCKICCGKSAAGITASGVFVMDSPYGLAVPKALLHSRLHVPNYLQYSAPFRFWRADDTGSALEEDWVKTPRVLHVDVRFRNHNWALWWGVRNLTVYIEVPR